MWNLLEEKSSETYSFFYKICLPPPLSKNWQRSPPGPSHPVEPRPPPGLGTQDDIEDNYKCNSYHLLAGHFTPAGGALWWHLHVQEFGWKSLGAGQFSLFRAHSTLQLVWFLRVTVRLSNAFDTVNVIVSSVFGTHRYCAGECVPYEPLHRCKLTKYGKYTGRAGTVGMTAGLDSQGKFKCPWAFVAANG